MTIDTIRQEISTIDRKIIALIAQRQVLAGKLALLKHREGTPIRDDVRRATVLQDAFDLAVEYQINPVYIGQIFELLIDMSEERQRECSGEGDLP